MLRNRGEDYNDFVTESYYYRDLIKGKKVSPCPNDYNSSIQTQKQYEEWLKQKHQELTKKPKKRGCRISKYFCWAAAPFYAKMASKLITILMPFFTSAVRP